MKETFDITGMTCAACSARVQKAAGEVSGVTEANVNLLKNSMELVYDGNPQTIDNVCAAIDKAGYGAHPRTVRNGQQVSILAEQGDFFFFETADGRYGWNGKKYFYCVFDFVHGGSIQIPGNYSNVSTDEVRAQEGYFYDFYNAKDDMTISLSEVMALEYPEDPEDIIEGEYAFWLDSMPPATYKDKTADSFTLSGYNGNRIYYIQYHVVDDVVYTIEFDCPIKNQDTCSQIVDLVVASFSA